MTEGAKFALTMFGALAFVVLAFGGMIYALSYGE